jgi:hypothetical protein
VLLSSLWLLWLRFPLISAANYLILEVGLLSLPFHFLVFGYVIIDYMKCNITSLTWPTMASFLWLHGPNRA